MRRTSVLVYCALVAVSVTAGLHPTIAFGQSVTSDHSADTWLPQNGTVSFTIDDLPDERWADVVVIVAGTDVTAFLKHNGKRWSYRAAALPLPSGAHEVVVQAVTSPTTWSELGRFPIRVLDGLGFREHRVDPRLGIENAGRPAQGTNDPNGIADPATFQEVAFDVGLETHHEGDGYRLRSQVNAMGSSNRERAIRFGDLGTAAPKFDLADYLFVAEAERTELSVGHVQVGAHPLLLDGFSSRGVQLERRAGRLTTSVAAVAGRSSVGWANLLGLSENGNRIYSAAVELDVLGERAGELKVGAAWMTGSVKPQAGFNSGAVVDSEKSRGFGFRTNASDPFGRVRVEGRFARSRFDNPADDLLEQGLELTPLNAAERSARSFDASAEIIRSVQVGERFPVTLGASYHHQRVDPEYRSVGSYLQPDINEHAMDVNGALGPLNLTARLARRGDNLDQIPSVLTTQTRSRQGSADLTLAQLFATESALLPHVSGSLGRVHQFGEGVPADGGFSESHVSDQVTANRSIALQWFHPKLQVGYQGQWTTQDNQQPGREESDFERASHTMTLGLPSTARFDVSLDGSRESTTNLALDEVTTTDRLGLTTNVRLWPRAAASAHVSQSWATDPIFNGEKRDAREVRLELSQSFSISERSGGGSSSGQAYVRFQRQRGGLLGFSEDGIVPLFWTLNTGLTLNLF